MNPTTVVAGIQLALDIIAQLGPQLQGAFSSGQISAEKQQELKNRIALIESGEAFQGPEWQTDQPTS